MTQRKQSMQTKCAPVSVVAILTFLLLSRGELRFPCFSKIFCCLVLMICHTALFQFQLDKNLKLIPTSMEFSLIRKHWNTAKISMETQPAATLVLWLSVAPKQHAACLHLCVCKQCGGATALIFSLWQCRGHIVRKQRSRNAWLNNMVPFGSTLMRMSMALVWLFFSAVMYILQKQVKKLLYF